MEEQLISFETAKLAKEKGFESDVSHSIYTEIGELKDPIAQMDLMRNQESIQEYFKLIKSFPSAPTQSLLQKWLKQTYKLFVSVTPCSDGEFIFTIYDLNKCGVGDVYVEDLIVIESDSYEEDEEALEIGLQETLKLVP